MRAALIVHIVLILYYEKNSELMSMLSLLLWMKTTELFGTEKNSLVIFNTAGKWQKPRDNSKAFAPFFSPLVAAVTGFQALDSTKPGLNHPGIRAAFHVKWHMQRCAGSYAGAQQSCVASSAQPCGAGGHCLWVGCLLRPLQSAS